MSRALLIVLVLASTARAWSESGHHIVALLAYDRLQGAEQTALVTLLESHPRYAEDFQPPEKIANRTRWRVGVLGYWPDIARHQPAYNRPKWHYHLGANFVIGDRSKVKVPAQAWQLPEFATLDTKDLHIAQAIKLCFRVASDKSQSASDRAIALSWVAHLVGDAHQPCHSGSLYAESVFPDGDRGANTIKVKQSGNLHALWDGLLGGRVEEGDVNRRLASIATDDALHELATRADDPEVVLPGVWLDESERYALLCVYSKEVLQTVKAVQRGLTEEMPVINLSDKYLEIAGRVARMRAYQAGIRLAKLWRAILQD
ncbi:MAG: S1/P1 nuclease [Planctomycetota bacterium]